MEKGITILISPNAFKESLSAKLVAKAVHRGIRHVWKNVNVIELPVADGGNGTLDVLISKQGGKIKKTWVTGPLGNRVNARWGILEKRKLAFIEMAESSGLHLIPLSQRNPFITTTYGTGELIRTALNFGVKEIIIGVGGSATVDGGVGMAMALGVKFLDKNGKCIGWGGEALNSLYYIDMSSLDSCLRKTKIRVACDVQNPLLGSKGTVAIFARQKGATFSMMPILESGINNLANVVKRDLKRNISKIPGSGAAGGLAAGLMVFCGAEIQSGADLVLETLNFDKYLCQADLVITGEGKLDKQSAHGKAPIAVALRAKKYGIPVIAIAGSLGENAHLLHRYGITYMQSIQSRSMSLRESMENASFLIQQVVEKILKKGRQIN